MERAIGERREEIIADIEENRADLDAAVEDLKVAAADAFDPVRVIARHPYAALTGALLVGLWAARRSP